MTIKVNGIELFYEKRGSGRPLILLHGNGEDHQIFDQISARLQQEFTVYAVDSRNHGQSMQTGVYDYEVMEEDLYSFIRELGLDGTGVLGFSDGAIVTLMLAMKHPEVLSRMMLLGVNLKPEDFREECYRELIEAFEETQDPLLKLMLEQPQLELKEMRKISVPVYIVAGEHDIFKPEIFSELAATIPGARLKIMEGHDHDSYITNQDILHATVREFFLKQERKSKVAT